MSDSSQSTLFGALLIAAIVARFYFRMLRTPQAAARDVEVFSRDLSRRVFLLLYLLLGAKIAVNAAAPNPQPVENFQDIVGWGAGALLVIRLLAARWLRITVFNPAGSRPSVNSP